MLPSRGMISSIDTPPPFKPGKYRHYKGSMYFAVGLACHESTHEWLVIYKPLFKHEGKPSVWVRPYEEFIGTVNTEDGQVPRYKPAKEEVVDEG